jgi:hypothetical protein
MAPVDALGGMRVQMLLVRQGVCFFFAEPVPDVVSPSSQQSQLPLIGEAGHQTGVEPLLESGVPPLESFNVKAL